MIDIESIINEFTVNDFNGLVKFLKLKNKRYNIKNIDFVTLIYKEKKTSKEVQKILYNDNKTAYHTLRKRIFDSLIDFIAQKNLKEEATTEMQLIKMILVAREFLVKKQYKTAFKLLHKAEKIAIEHSFFTFLNEIYHTKIQYSIYIDNLDLSSLINKHQQNFQNYILEEQLNIVYAKVKHQFNKRVFKSEVVDFNAYLNQLLKEHQININNVLTFKSLYQIISIFNDYAFVSKNYYDFEEFLINSYHQIKDNQHKEKQLYYYIQILYTIANMYFRNKKFAKSVEFLELMHHQMESKNRKYYKEFFLKHQTLKALNLCYSGNLHDAIIIANKHINYKSNDTEFSLILYLSLIMFQFKNENYTEVKQLYKKLYHTNSWYEKRVGREWLIKKDLIEIILYVELNDIDFAESKLKNFKKRNKHFLTEISQERVMKFIEFIEKFMLNKEKISSQNFINDIAKSLETIEKSKEDIFMMSFYAWFKAKINKTKHYDEVLQLMIN